MPASAIPKPPSMTPSGISAKRPPIREVAEERLHDRGAQRRRQDEQSCRCERETSLGDEERHQGGHGPLVDVRKEVPGGESGHRPFVYAFFHAFKLEISTAFQRRTGWSRAYL